MSCWCHISNFRSLGYLEPSQKHLLYPSNPPSPGWIFWLQRFLTHIYSASSSCWCLVSNLRSLGCLEPNQRHPYPQSPGWISGWWVVPHTHFEDRLCLIGAMFKFQVSRISGTQSKTPLSSTISRLDLWVTDGSWCIFCKYIMSWCWCDSNFGSSGRNWTELKPKRGFPHTTIFDLSTIVPTHNQI